MKRKGTKTQRGKTNTSLGYDGGAQRRRSLGVRKRRVPMHRDSAAVQKIFDEMSDRDGVQDKDHESPTFSHVLGVLCGYSLV